MDTKKAAKYLIIRNDEGLLWSNVIGWCDGDDVCTLFTLLESLAMNLPMGGRWENA